jgi:hypothetical protein
MSDTTINRGTLYAYGKPIIDLDPVKGRLSVTYTNGKKNEVPFDALSWESSIDPEVGRKR